MKKEVGPGAIAAAVVVLLVVLVFAGIKFFGKSGQPVPTDGPNKAAYDEYNKTHTHPKMTRDNGPSTAGK